MENTFPGCREALRQAFLRKKIPDEAIPMVTASLSENTIKQFNTTISKWWKFCEGICETIFNSGLGEILNFLNQEYKKGAKYATLNTHRAALGLLFSMKQHEETINRFLRGVF